jgi:hypothetical protein
MHTRNRLSSPVFGQRRKLGACQETVSLSEYRVKLSTTLLVQLLAALLWSSHSEGQSTSLDDCVGPASTVCFDSTAIPVVDECGETFFRYRGRIAWPPLRYVGPVTIAVKSQNDRLSTYPLYVEVSERSDPEEGCRSNLSGHLILVAQGGTGCGGTWETVGPVDLRPFGVQVGTLYDVRCVFFEDVPRPFPERSLYSVGIGCIRVTTEVSSVSQSTWSSAKLLYR